MSKSGRSVSLASAFLVLARVVVVAAALALAAASATSLVTAEAPRVRLRLASLDVEGLRRYSREAVAAAARLSVGQSIFVDEIPQALVRMRESGLFASVASRYKVVNDSLQLTLVIEEIEWGMPVVFDNFVWFSEEELRAAVAAAVPSFDGTAPRVGGVTGTIVRVLQGMIDRKGIAGRVEHRLDGGAGSGGMGHLFMVTGRPIPICALRFPGASLVPEQELVERSQELIGRDFSRRSAVLFAERVLQPLYGGRGYLGARVGPPQVSLEADPACLGGVGLEMPVQEGPRYRWDRTEWAGGGLIGPQEMDGLIGFRQEDPAELPRVEEGLEALRQRYKGAGYLEMEGQVEPVVDHEARRVICRITIRPGDLWRVGKLSTAGLPPSAVSWLQEAWRKVEGEPYTRERITAFMKEKLPSLAPYLRERRGVTYGVTENRDRETSTVQVTIAFQ